MREIFSSLEEAIAYYRVERGLTVTVEISEIKRTATLRSNREPGLATYVAIWPAKDWRGDVEPIKVWGEEY